jgi:integrase
MVAQPTRYDFTNFKREFHAAQVAVGMDYPTGHPLHFTIKDLRRTGATWAWRETKDLASISAMLGHKNWSTTKRYLHITDADTAKIAAVMDRLSNKALRERATSFQGSTGLAGAGNMMKVVD